MYLERTWKMFKENLRLIFVAYTKVEAAYTKVEAAYTKVEAAYTKVDAAYTKDMNLESTLRSP